MKWSSVTTERFPKQTRPVDGDRSKHDRFRTITCGKCGAVGELPERGAVKNMPPEIVAKRFRAMGWDIGAKSDGDRCPEHNGKTARKVGVIIDPVAQTITRETDGDVIANNRRNRRALKVASSDVRKDHDLSRALREALTGKPVRSATDKATKVVADNPYTKDLAMVDPTPLTTDLPKPTREQVRKIHEELDARYDVPAQRYKGTMTDKALGELLKMPWRWVADERERAWGPDDSEARAKRGADVDALRGEIGVLTGKVEAHVADGMKLMDRLAELKAKADAL